MRDHAERAARIIKEVKYITLATASADGHPWNSPLFAAYDKDLNFYWFSDKESQHSTNVQATGEAFVVVYDSTVPEGAGEGVYLQMTVQELSDEAEVMAAKAIYDGRAETFKTGPYSNYSGEAPLRFYKATPLRIWMNDVATTPDGSYLKDTRVEVIVSQINLFSKAEV